MSPNDLAAMAEHMLCDASKVNVNKQERKLSLAMGAALVGLGLGSGLRLRGLLIASVGGALVYRGVTGHCHAYEALGIDSSQAEGGEQEDDGQEGSELQGQEAGDRQARSQSEEHADTEPFEFYAPNQVDRDRFEKMKNTQVDRGREEGKAGEIAAEEVKELRRREGRSKQERTVRLEELDEAARGRDD